MSTTRRLEDYLAEIAAGIEGGRRARRIIVAELATYFDDALEPDNPERCTLAQAIERFGEPREIAAGFNAVRRSRSRRRSRALAVLASCLAIPAAPSLLTASNTPRPALYSLAAKRPALGVGLVVVDPADGRVLARIYGQRT